MSARGVIVVLVAIAMVGADKPGEYGVQDIFNAVRQDSMSAIKQALADGADINQRQADSGQTPLSEFV